MCNCEKQSAFYVYKLAKKLCEKFSEFSLKKMFGQGKFLKKMHAVDTSSDFYRAYDVQ